MVDAILVDAILGIGAPAREPLGAHSQGRMDQPKKELTTRS